MSKPWKVCALCSSPNSDDKVEFSSPIAFGDHLRLLHSRTQPNGLLVCQYGPNSVCLSLKNETIGERDYETHIAKCHIFAKLSPSESLSSLNGLPYANNNNHSSHTNNNSNHSHLPTAISSSEDEPLGDHLRNGGKRSLNGYHTALTLLQSTHNNPAFPLPLKNSQFDYETSLLNSLTSSSPSDSPADPQWTVYSSNQILASSINDPSKARTHYDNLFTKDWGFTFVETSVTPFPTFKKPPKNLMLDSYIKRVNRRSKVILQRPPLSREPSRDDALSLTAVPKLFFDETFDLEDGDTFGSLLHLFGFERSEDNLGDFFEQSSMTDIQGRLSEYLDVVEQDLASQIGKRSKDFFQVMSSMDSVMDKLISCIRQVSTIRANCGLMDDFLVRPATQNILLTKTRNAVRQLLKKINWIATVHQAQPTIQLLLSKNDYAGALDLISTSQECVTQELSGVISFRHLKLQLMEIERVIEQMMNEEFVKYLTAEWNRPTGSPGDKTFSIEEEKLLSIIYGMLKLQKFNFIDTFREEAFTAIKTNVKQTVIEALSKEDNIEVSHQRVVEQTKLLSFPSWIAFLQRLFDRLATLFRRVSSVYCVIRDGFEMVSSNVSLRKQSYSSMSYLEDRDEKEPEDKAEDKDENDDDKGLLLQDDYKEVKENLKEILCSVCDFANSRAAQIIELKVNDGSLDRLESKEFMDLINIIQTFTDECEELCGKKSPNLKLVIQLQSNKLLKKFHDERKTRQVQLLDLEQWKPVANLSEQFQTLCAALVNITDSHTLGELYERYKATKGQKSASGGGKGSNLVSLGEHRFVLVNAVINLLYSVLDYCEYAANIPYLAGDFLSKLIDLLKHFNARTSQLVLGALALQVSGLKTITARTLVICARGLAFIVHLIPALKIHFGDLFQRDLEGQRAKVNGQDSGPNRGLETGLMKQLRHFDEVVQLYENHYKNITDKILNIVGEVVRSNMSKWVAKAPIPSAAFQSVSTHLKRLHDNIQEYISEKELILLFEDIHRIVIEGFREQLAELKIVNDGGPQHGLVTQELTFYIQSLNNLSIGPKLKLSTMELWPN